MGKLKIANREFGSRLFLGTGKFASMQLMRDAVIESYSELVTVALRRVSTQNPDDELLSHLSAPHINLLPNTSGARTAAEAVLAAELAREALETEWVKLEIHPDPRYLLPDPRETLRATEELSKKGFVVLPYTAADPVLCKLLEEAGAAAVMPLGSPIGSNAGLQTRGMLEIIIEQARVPVIIDAGIGAPSHAAEALEFGADAVLVNTAIASAGDPVQMARAFRLAVEAGRFAFESRLPSRLTIAKASSPLTSFLEDAA